MNTWSFIVWLHVLAGITWIGLLYYFNFVQVPAAAEAASDSEGPGPAAISKYVAPRALLWFRWGALATWITGAMALESSGAGLLAAFTLSGPLAVQIIGIGAWLGTTGFRLAAGTAPRALAKPVDPCLAPYCGSPR